MLTTPPKKKRSANIHNTTKKTKTLYKYSQHNPKKKTLCKYSKKKKKHCKYSQHNQIKKRSANTHNTTQKKPLCKYSQHNQKQKETHCKYSQHNPKKRNALQIKLFVWLCCEHLQCVTISICVVRICTTCCQIDEEISWFAGAFSICMFFLKLQRFELSTIR